MAPAGLLSAAELERMGQFTAEKRRREWLLGRYTAKQLVQRYLDQETGQRPPLDALVIAREFAEVLRQSPSSTARPCRWTCPPAPAGSAGAAGVHTRPQGRPAPARGQRHASAYQSVYQPLRRDGVLRVVCCE